MDVRVHADVVGLSWATISTSVAVFRPTPLSVSNSSSVVACDGRTDRGCRERSLQVLRLVR